MYVNCSFFKIIEYSDTKKNRKINCHYFAYISNRQAMSHLIPYFNINFSKHLEMGAIDRDLFTSLQMPLVKISAISSVTLSY
jgi:hypothetical protein